jgi:hypothetical protein
MILASSAEHDRKVVAGQGMGTKVQIYPVANV